jgi:hypothetical protein
MEQDFPLQTSELDSRIHNQVILGGRSPALGDPTQSWSLYQSSAAEWPTVGTTGLGIKGAVEARSRIRAIAGNRPISETAANPYYQVDAEVEAQGKLSLKQSCSAFPDMSWIPPAAGVSGGTSLPTRPVRLK